MIFNYIYLRKMSGEWSFSLTDKSDGFNDELELITHNGDKIIVFVLNYRSNYELIKAGLFKVGEKGTYKIISHKYLGVTVKGEYKVYRKKNEEQRKYLESISERIEEFDIKVINFSNGKSVKFSKFPSKHLLFP